MTTTPSTTSNAAEQISFGSLRIAFDDRLLRPRPWTVAQSRWATELADDVPEGPVLEVCAGAGHIGLLALVGTTRRLVSVDISPVASSFTLRNAESAGLRGRVEARTGPMQDVLAPDERFPLIIADPPWVPRAMVGTFPEDPVLAIDGGDDGMEVVRTTVAVIERHLAPGGAAVLQVGTLEQADEVGTWLTAGGRLEVVATSQEERGVLALIRTTSST